MWLTDWLCLSVWLTDWLSVWLAVWLTDWLSVYLFAPVYLKIFLPYSTPLIAERQHLSWNQLSPPHPCPCPFSFSNEERRTNLSCWKNLWNISLKEQYALESSQEVQWHELDDLWQNKKYSPINKSYYHKGKTMSNRWNNCVNNTFISWIIFSWVRLKKKIPSSQFKCLQHKTSWSSLHMSQVSVAWRG